MNFILNLLNPSRLPPHYRLVIFELPPSFTSYLGIPDAIIYVLLSVSFRIVFWYRAYTGITKDRITAFLARHHATEGIRK
jgi:hypothetical protein